MFPRTTCAALWVIVIGLPIALFAPSALVCGLASGATAAGMVMLVVILVLELVNLFVTIKPTSSRTPGGDFQAEGRLNRNPVGCNCDDGCNRPNCCRDDAGCEDDLVTGTAAGLIDWSE